MKHATSQNKYHYRISQTTPSPNVPSEEKTSYPFSTRFVLGASANHITTDRRKGNIRICQETKNYEEKNATQTLYKGAPKFAYVCPGTSKDPAPIFSSFSSSTFIEDQKMSIIRLQNRIKNCQKMFNAKKHT